LPPPAAAPPALERDPGKPTALVAGFGYPDPVRRQRGGGDPAVRLTDAWALLGAPGRDRSRVDEAVSRPGSHLAGRTARCDARAVPVTSHRVC
jgi:hypothetical protein